MWSFHREVGCYLLCFLHEVQSERLKSGTSYCLGINFQFATQYMPKVGRAYPGARECHGECHYKSSTTPTFSSIF